MRPARRPRFLLTVALLSAVVSASGACLGGKSHSATSTPSAASRLGIGTPDTQRSPMPAPADPQLAQTLSRQGEYEKAIDVYAAVAQQKSGQARQDALLAQAQLYSRTGNSAQARDVLTTYLANAGPSADGGPARYMLASVLDDLGDPQGALDNYDRYIAAGGPASDFAAVERAKMLERVGRTVDAEQAAEAVLAGDLDQSFKASFTFSMASVFEQAGDDADALAWYNRVKTTPGGDVANALARTGGIKKRLGDATWTADYLQAITDSPGAASALDLLDALDAAQVPVDDYTRGLVDYRAGKDDLAKPALTAATDGAHAAEAHYYLGAIAERANDPDTAITEYGKVAQTNAASPLASDALWWRGRLLESKQEYGDAGDDYRLLATQYPDSDRAGDARFRQALVLYLAGDKSGAITSWAALAANTSGDDNLRARFWQGRALIEQGGKDNDAVLKALITDAPTSFYALRAEVLLGDNDTKQRTAKLDDGAPDWGKIAQYVEKQTGTDPENAEPAVLADPKWEEAEALSQVGLSSQSDAIFEDIIAAHDGDAVALYHVTKKLQEDGRPDLAARSATRLLNAILQPTPAAPDDLLRMAYPVVYRELVDTSASDEQVSPLLLLALVRQESYYDPDAGSIAGALGLTQVVPSTGASIAQQLGVANFTAADLFRPNVSLEFGAQYLSSQLRDFGSNAYQALAAYNGGGATATDANQMARGDVDLFVQDLEFDETRTYVERVMENYARYRQLYEHIDRPSLPN